MLVCAFSVACIFIFFANKVASASDAEARLISELHARQTSIGIAQQILAEVDKAREESQATEMYPHLDDIESLALMVIGGE